MNQKTELFIKLFNQLEKILECETKKYDYDSFNSKLEEFCRKYPKYNNFKSNLKQINKTRNALIHEYINTELAIPSNWSIQIIKTVLKNLKNPPTALIIATTQGIYICKPESLISNVIKKMAENTYTHVPVIDKGQFMGVFSETSLVVWLGKKAENNGFLLEETKIKDILQYIKEPINDFWEFIPRNMDVYQIKEKFYQATLEKKGRTFKRLGVLFVTENGKQNEKILGIITAWDLQKIK